MKRYWIWKALKIAVFVALAVVVFTFVVMSLWNWLLPPLFGWPALGFGQALGLLVLSRILFGGWRGGHRGMHWRGRMAERWAQMTPEEREKFREGMRGRCGHHRGEGAQEAKA
jgi:hypothetical protein